MWPEQQLYRVVQKATIFQSIPRYYPDLPSIWVFGRIFNSLPSVLRTSVAPKVHPVVQRVLTTAFCIFSLRCSLLLCYGAFFLWSRWFQPQCQKEIGKNVIQFKNFTAFTLLKRHASLNKLDMYSLFRAFRDVLAMPV